MDFQVRDKWFLVTGAGSGLGRAVAERLLAEDACVIACARNLHDFPEHEKLMLIPGDVRDPEIIGSLLNSASQKDIRGVFINAGGPPARTFLETTTEDWDEAYRLLFRWKVELVHGLLPHFIRRRFGRIVFSESISVKQPVENLVLSNSLRMAVVGLAKTISEEYAPQGITVNVMAPGYHDTAAIDRLFLKKSQQTGKSTEHYREQIVKEINVGKLGDPDEFAILALWLLSPLSAYITGQTLSVDGGTVRYSMG
ncbi:MAG: SDR family oxidoreductase [Bacteroidetes bacterium]|nr:SDR family oxidoreductase [Bacteroidota bacterium]